MFHLEKEAVASVKIPALRCEVLKEAANETTVDNFGWWKVSFHHESAKLIERFSEQTSVFKVTDELC